MLTDCQKEVQIFTHSKDFLLLQVNILMARRGTCTVQLLLECILNLTCCIQIEQKKNYCNVIDCWKLIILLNIMKPAILELMVALVKKIYAAVSDTSLSVLRILMALSMLKITVHSGCKCYRGIQNLRWGMLLFRQ